MTPLAPGAFSHSGKPGNEVPSTRRLIWDKKAFRTFVSPIPPRANPMSPPCRSRLLIPPASLSRSLWLLGTPGGRSSLRSRRFFIES